MIFKKIWNKITSNKATLPAAVLATLVCAIGMLFVWVPQPQAAAEMKRFGETMSQTLAQTSAGYMLHRDQIELAVVANHTVQFPEVMGVVFYGVNNELIAISGTNEIGAHYTAPATMDDTITGYVTVVLNRDAFLSTARYFEWFMTFLIITAAPFISLFTLKLFARGSRSIPIVTVPEPTKHDPQKAYGLTINLHNQIALSREQRTQAVEDALVMAKEVCAIHQGISCEIPDRGVIMLFDKTLVTPAQAVCASFLVQNLLDQYDTRGHFRAFLTTVTAPGAPGELSSVVYDQIAEVDQLDNYLMLASLAKHQTVLLGQNIYSAMSEQEKTWATSFEHPLLEDFDNVSGVYFVEDLPDQQAQLIDNQAQLILGFDQATG